MMTQRAESLGSGKGRIIHGHGRAGMYLGKSRWQTAPIANRQEGAGAHRNGGAACFLGHAQQMCLLERVGPSLSFPRVESFAIICLLGDNNLNKRRTNLPLNPPFMLPILSVSRTRGLPAYGAALLGEKGLLQ